MNYEEDITIDPDSLDVEWMEQPRLMIKYSRHAAQMRKALDEAKQNLDIAKAEADKSLRNHPEKYGLSKVTDTAVANQILIHPKYKEAYSEYLDAKYESDMAISAVVAFEQRKSALENLVRLHGQQYFAGPSLPRDLSKEWEQKQKQKESNAKIKITRRNN